MELVEPFSQLFSESDSSNKASFTHIPVHGGTKPTCGAVTMDADKTSIDSGISMGMPNGVVTCDDCGQSSEDLHGVQGDVASRRNSVSRQTGKQDNLQPHGKMVSFACGDMPTNWDREDAVINGHTLLKDEGDCCCLQVLDRVSGAPLCDKKHDDSDSGGSKSKELANCGHGHINESKSLHRMGLGDFTEMSLERLRSLSDVNSYAHKSQQQSKCESPRHSELDTLHEYVVLVEHHSESKSSERTDSDVPTTHNSMGHKLSKPPAKESWLLRFFESKLFDMSIAIQYLYNSKEPGVQTYLGKLLRISKCW